MSVSTDAPVKFSVWLPKDLHRRLKVAAAQRDLTVSEILRGLAESWLARQEETSESVRRG